MSKRTVSKSVKTPRGDKKAPRKNRKGGFRDPWAEREARRYERPIPSREAILALLTAHDGLMDADAVAVALGLVEPVDVQALQKRLRAMLRDGQLLQNRHGDFAPANKLDLIPGTVLANAEGYGFLRPDEGGDDLFLSPAEMRKVLHGDRILASVVGLDRRGRRKGAVVEVLERRPARIVGRVVVEGGVTVVAPDDRRITQDVLIPPDQLHGARAGQIVVAEITEPPNAQRGPIGTICAVLGDRLKPSLVVEMAIASHGLPASWPDDVLAQAQTVPPEVTAADKADRVDIRDLPLVTIDGDDSRDFDDAVFAQPRRGGGFRLVVAIADVSHYVQPDTPLDAEAFERSTSTYFPGFVVPMLPETLSNGICSLNPKVERLCMVCDMSVNTEGKVTRSKFYQAVMRSHARLTYRRVWQAIGERDDDARAELADVLPQLEHLHALYKVLAAARGARGAIEFESSETKFALSANGEVQSLGSAPRNDAHRLIEECMIAANVQAAKFLDRKRIPALFRVHASPPVTKYDDLLEFLRQYRLTLPPADEVTPADYNALLAQVEGKPEFELVQSVLLRSMARAAYSPENQGHFGLALEAYAHFTSPIRRYPDLLVHRAIAHALSGGKRSNYLYPPARMAAMAGHCSERERRAEEAERDVDERYKCAWMEKHIGEVFDGVVTGVTSFGLFVDVEPSRVSGLVHVSQLSNDYYHFDPARHELKGERTGQRFRLGDRVTVQCIRASMEDRKIDFRLTERGKDKPAPARSKSAQSSKKPASAKKPVKAGKKPTRRKRA
ncbi:MAG TPA: ribonuclease R [Rhodanobacteraceae bacterium]